MQESYKSHTPEKTVADNNQERGSRHEESVDVTRRDFLKRITGSMALMAVYGCHQKFSTEQALRTAEILESHPFVERWGMVLADTLRDLDKNTEIQNLLGEKRLQSLKETLRTFNVHEYIRLLSERSGVSKGQINAELLSFSVEPSKEDGIMAEASKEARAITLFLGDRIFQKESVKNEAIHQILRHELAHMFSFNYEANEEALRSAHISFMRTSSNIEEMVFINPALYEGATEVVAVLGSQNARYQSGMEQGYRGGAALSAYVLAELAGKDVFLNSYLQKDNRILARALNEKMGDGASFFLTEPISPELLLGGDHENLEILYQVATHKDEGRYNIPPLQNLLEKARAAGIPERAEFRRSENGFSSLTHLYTISSADGAIPKFQLNGVAEGPLVYRFSKKTRERPTVENGVVTKNELYRPRQKLMIILSPDFMTSEVFEENIARATESFREVLSMEDPSGPEGTDPLVVGIDAYVDDRLRVLAECRDLESKAAIQTMNEMNSYMHGKIRAALEAVYKNAGVHDDLIVK